LFHSGAVIPKHNFAPVIKQCAPDFELFKIQKREQCSRNEILLPKRKLCYFGDAVHRYKIADVHMLDLACLEDNIR